MIRFEVADTGPGIPSDRLDTLFSDYVQVDASVSRRFGGTGLGLAICKRLAERMGGSVGVTSTLGSGSCFHVTLPFTPAETVERKAAATGAEAAEAELRTLVKARAAPLRVLVADDNETNQLVATSLLAKLGIASDVAENGVLAVSAVRDGAYDLVLMDMQMPEMDGLEATRTIRALAGDKARIPIVGLTANAFGDDRRRCRETGMDGFLAKPVRKHELARGIAEALTTAPRRPAHAAAGAA
jgi:CheY-like chemotaxis protein